MPSRAVGRYRVFEAFASGGMAAVHFGRSLGDAGFAKTVAIKKLHESFGEDASIVATLLDEARLAARIQHPNVVPTLDVVVSGTEILLVLEYVHGESLAKLIRPPAPPVPLPVVRTVVSSMLHGLHAAHMACSDTGEPLGIVHRDVSPQNVLVGADGQARVLDFGIAKARGRMQTTREGQVKGKLAYMAPEQIRLGEVTPRTDVFAAGIVLWEMLTGERLFAGENEGHVMLKVLESPIPRPSEKNPHIPTELDRVVARALARDPADRYASAEAFALALEESGPLAPASAVAQWVRGAAGASLEQRERRVREIERGDVEAGPVRVTSAEEATRTEAPTGAAASEHTGTEQRALALSTKGQAQAPKRSLAPVGAALLAAAAVFAGWRFTQREAANAPTAEASTAQAPPRPLHATAIASPATSESAIATSPTARPNIAPSSSAARAPAARPLPSATGKPAPPAVPSGSAKASPFYRLE